MKKLKRVNRRKNTQSSQGMTLTEVWVIIILIAIVVLYYLSLGKINFFDKDAKYNRLQWIENRLEFLYADVKNKRELKERLDKRVKKWFFITRGILALMYLSLNAVTFYFMPETSLLDRLGVLLNFNQAFVLLLLTILFVRYETPKDFKLFNKLIHLLVQKVVYNSHKQLANELDFIENEIGELTNEKNEINSKLETNKKVGSEMQTILNEDDKIPPVSNN